MGLTARNTAADHDTETARLRKQLHGVQRALRATDFYLESARAQQGDLQAARAEREKLERASDSKKLAWQNAMETLNTTAAKVEEAKGWWDRLTEAEEVRKAERPKQQHAKNLLKMREGFEGQLGELSDRCAKRLDQLAADLELRRKVHIHEIEERKNLHINDLIGAGEVRRELYHLLFGDKNYLQIVHNLPLFVVGYAPPPAALARLLGRLRRPRARAALCVLSFVLDPFAFGLFKSGSGISIAAQRETRPLIAYARAAARVGAFASALPDGRTPLTSAGRSQLLAVRGASGGPAPLPALAGTAPAVCSDGGNGSLQVVCCSICSSLQRLSCHFRR